MVRTPEVRFHPAGTMRSPSDSTSRLVRVGFDWRADPNRLRKKRFMMLSG
jgi:hypothetical protein